MHVHCTCVICVSVCVCICTYVRTYVHTYIYVRAYIIICNRLPWQLGFTPTISRGMGGAMVQIINQTGSANPLQVSCTKVSQVYSWLCCFIDHNYNMYIICVCLYMCLCVHIYMYVCMYMCMCVHVCTSVL